MKRILNRILAMLLAAILLAAPVCVREKSLDTCADCPQMDSCPTLGQIAVNSPFVLENLKQLKQDNA